MHTIAPTSVLADRQAGTNYKGAQLLLKALKCCESETACCGVLENTLHGTL